MQIELKVNTPSSTFLKNPQDSRLGEDILLEGICLMNELGFEQFTFKKLAIQIGSSEVSIYRYFESKHQFLQYLFAWHWGWMEHKIHLSCASLPTTTDKLNCSLRICLGQNTTQIFEVKFENELQQIIQNEGLKAIFIKNVDEVNKLGVFENYKKLIDQLVNWVIEICPNYPYPNMLITNMIEGSMLQNFYAEHLPRLTNSLNGKTQSTDFFMSIFTLTIQNYSNVNK